MKVLIVGSGGREHALAWRLRRSPLVSALWVAGGNAGTAQVADNLPIAPENLDGVVEAAQSLGVDLVVVGPERPLADGIVDRLSEMGIPAFGPTALAARLEGQQELCPGGDAGGRRARPGVPGFSATGKRPWTFCPGIKARWW